MDCIALLEVHTAQIDAGKVELQGDFVGSLEGDYLTYHIPFNRSFGMGVPIHEIKRLEDGDIRVMTNFSDPLDEVLFSSLGIGDEVFCIFSVDKEYYDSLGMPKREDERSG